MSLIIKILAAAAGVPIIFALIFVLGIIVGDVIARGPMEEVCSVIEPGMSRAEVEKVMSQDPTIHDWGSGSTMQLSQHSNNITSSIVGSWLCMCKVHLEDDQVEEVDDVFCVD